MAFILICSQFEPCVFIERGFRAPGGGVHPAFLPFLALFRDALPTVTYVLEAGLRRGVFTAQGLLCVDLLS